MFVCRGGRGRGGTGSSVLVGSRTESPISPEGGEEGKDIGGARQTGVVIGKRRGEREEEEEEEEEMHEGNRKYLSEVERR